MTKQKVKTALILGGAKSVFEDYQRAMKMHDFDAVIAVNDIGIEIPEIDYWCSMHPEKMDRWADQRRANGYVEPKSFWTSKDRMGRCKKTKFENIRNTRGGSGLLAVYVARHLGFHKKVLAGIPMQPEGEHYHSDGKWKECKLYRIVWEKNSSLPHDVRSMGGWTKEFFGEPDEEWLTTVGASEQYTSLASG